MSEFVCSSMLQHLLTTALLEAEGPASAAQHFLCCRGALKALCRWPAAGYSYCSSFYSYFYSQVQKKNSFVEAWKSSKVALTGVMCHEGSSCIGKALRSLQTTAREGSRTRSLLSCDSVFSLC
ncbi:hypothetical protein DUNSADRAFT_13909 [Dunaliella salina]|uniref:Secreted protein n=1 Tax=Dunaliella salina TaxID=3046 RepID=A0ABQ7G8L4_DUNSA|nr:hypothetical protein DUNSADRAFT_13909 [Dunaliella salina]|eukprot:KAF5830899.1 hypothetical protein DUNSADRAFT_13909 [Dunaliella salina]